MGQSLEESNRSSPTISPSCSLTNANQIVIQSQDLSSSLESLTLTPSPTPPSYLKENDECGLKTNSEITNKLSPKRKEKKEEKRKYLPLPMKRNEEKSGKMRNFKNINGSRNNCLPYPIQSTLDIYSENVSKSAVTQDMSSELLENYFNYFRGVDLTQESSSLALKEKCTFSMENLESGGLLTSQIAQESTHADVKQNNEIEMFREKLREDKLYIKIMSKGLQCKYYMNIRCSEKIGVLEKQPNLNSFQIEFPGGDQLKFYHIKSPSQNLISLYKCFNHGSWIPYPEKKFNVYFLNSYVPENIHKSALKYFQGFIGKQECEI